MTRLRRDSVSDDAIAACLFLISCLGVRFAAKDFQGSIVDFLGN